ncbi:hypothetical protein DLAC_06020 [Tieghemostelium lacteum]|uniref:SnoaL-like domain-containing protein n=1 Tax=Tieghemostelium lacteum TaxID=361077 RepID=A0A151ZHF7_TIELA|nr:hypothetical protein DLAC_06020 [Tieghemostelium lacteum]|eukprot:KYQ93349.1 hypothetical protein DLAC_06020 [Tieghemostelium lacteum]
MPLNLKKKLSKIFKKDKKDKSTKPQENKPLDEKTPVATTTITTTTATVNVASNETIEQSLNAIIKGIQSNKILEVFDKYYHDEVVMYENGTSENRTGKAANRKAEEGFVNNATIHSAVVNKLLITGNNTSYEMTMDFTYGGHRIQKTQWAFQEWKDGKIIKEEFLYGEPKPQSETVEDSFKSIIKGIQDNKILEVFDKYYHDEIVMYENGKSENRTGKASNRKAEEGFVNNATIHSAVVNKLLITGNNTGYEMTMDFTYGGHRIQKTQWAFQEWKDGKIIKEEFLYGEPKAETK